jgi:two-component system, cell cycle sensor histidine kinase and response regulator CckA
MKNTFKDPGFSTLRSLAEEKLQSAATPVSAPLSPEESQRLIHELQVHQIELEMQNEELRQTRHEMEMSFNRYSDLYHFAPVGYLTLDPNGIVNAVNLNGASLLGVERSNLAGKRLASYVAHPSRPAFLAFLEMTFRSFTKEACELEMLKEGVTPLFVRIEAMATASGQECRFALIDISERKNLELQIGASEAHYRLLTEDVSDVVWKLDSNLRITYISPADELLRGYRADEVIGRTAYEMMSAEGIPVLAEKFQLRQEAEGNGETTGSITFEIQQQCKDGRVIWTEILSTPERDAYGAITGYHGITRDITQRKQTATLEQQLLHAQKLESLGVLAGGIAHDFNNILMVIFGNADLAMLELDRESPAFENLRAIQTAAARAADLTKQMLAYSGKGKFVTENLDLNQLLKNALHLLQVSISKKSAIRLDLNQEIPQVEGDATQLNQIVMNLVINASEAIGNEGGLITLATSCIECDRTVLNDCTQYFDLEEGRYVCLEVTDTGCGMDMDTIAKLFDPFFTTKFTGRGLGLSAVLGIIKGHKGAIKVSSNLGMGTTFRILFPASKNAAAEPAPEGHLDGKDGWQGRGRVLLVDDEDMVLSVGVAMLKTLGFTPITASDGREAIDTFKASPDFALVILDLTMPRMDGEQCFREMRQLDSQVKVILASGYNEQEVTRKFAGEGLAGFIQKPYTLSELRSSIRKAV